jgi:type IV pilus assembly protein PilA
MNQDNKPRIVRKAGFTLTELMATVAIVGILSTVALPNYLRSVNKARQAEVANQISQLSISIQGFREEFLRNPS